MVTEHDINDAFDNKYDGIDKFDLVREILELKETIEQSGLDTSPCRDCGRDVMCYPEGMTVICKSCLDKQESCGQ